MKCVKCNNDLTKEELEARQYSHQKSDEEPYREFDGVSYTGYWGGCLCFNEELRRKRYGMPKPEICECNPICIECTKKIHESHTARLVDPEKGRNLFNEWLKNGRK